jgi:hypothetical protein
MTTLSLSLALILGVLSQAPTTAKGAAKAGEKMATAKSDTAMERLAFMKDSLAQYNLHPADDPKTVFRLKPDPVLRFNNPVGTVHDGAIFLWLDPAERPAAAVQVYRGTDGTWFQAFSSLSTDALVSDRTWNPSRPGVEFKPVPDAPRPADSPERRLRQMHELANGFSAELNWDPQTWHNLRLLTKPLARYGKPGSEALDGALFTFVLATDAEVYLLLEMRNGQNGPEWQYAFAPEANATIRCSRKGKQVWEFAFDRTASGGRAPYFFTTFSR